MYKLTKLDADLKPLPDDAKDHPVIQVERDLLAHPLLVANASPAKPVTQQEAVAWAEGLTINGWAWHLATVEEAFLACDHNRKDGVLDPTFFTNVKPNWAWTSTLDPDTAGVARYVDLDDGGSGWLHRVHRYQALAVRACQSI